MSENNVSMIELPSAAYAAQPMRLNDTYGFINTMEVVDRLGKHGWFPVAGNQTRPRKQSRLGYQKHLIRFRHESFNNVLDGNNRSHLEIIGVNSHDGSSSFQLMLGWYRIACSNGLVVGTNLDTIRVVHSKRLIETLDDSIETLAARIPDTIEKVKYLSTKRVDTATLYDFTQKVVSERLKHIDNIISVDNMSALQTRRVEDNENNLFTDFNKIQESVIRGGIRFSQKILNSDGTVKEYKQRTTRKLTSITQCVKLNQFMWEKVLEIAA